MAALIKRTILLLKTVWAGGVAIAVADMDGDGDEDWVVGNFGENSILRPTVEEPVRLYVSDFDDNLSKDPILTYYRQHKEYTFNGLDELSKQLVYLKKQYRVYNDFAQSELQDMFPASALEKSLQLEVRTFASVFVRNEGAGTLVVERLPQAAQISPVMAILLEDLTGDEQKDILLGGNFYELQPSIGRQDASFGTLLQGAANGIFIPLPNRNTRLFLDGQVRDFQLIRRKGQRHLLVARNNASLQMFLLTKSP